MDYSNWLHYFEANQNHFSHIDWKNVSPLEVTEIALISVSIKQFQRGEHSEGKHFLKYARTLNDPDYTDTVKLFIKEEQDHAAVLGTFMDLQGIERIGKDWLDNTFRWLRKMSGLEVTVTVLLTAEIMAFPFYRSLAAATGNKTLKQICDQILVDEEMHIRFQSYTLMDLYQQRSRPLRSITIILHRILMAGTIIMVWIWHSRVLRKGGYTFPGHFNAAWSIFRRCEMMMKGLDDNRPVTKKIINAA